MSVHRWLLLATASTLVVTAQAAGPASTGAVARDVLAATDTWGPVHSFERSPLGESMVVNARGVTTMVWGSQKGWPEPVKATQRTPDGRWRAPVRLGIGYQPVVAADAAGNLVAAWSRDRQGFTTGVWASRKPVGKPWTTAVHLSRDKVAPAYPDGGSVYGAANLDITMGHGGSTLVTWEWGNWERELPFHIQAVYRPARGTWGSVVTLTPRAEGSNAHAAFARNGTTWVAYERVPASGQARINVRSRSTAGVWSPATRVGTGSLGEVSVDRHGDVRVVYASGRRIRIAVRPAARGGWQASFPVTPKSARVRVWSVAMNGFGDALVTYRWPGDQVQAVRRAPGGRWTSPKTLTDMDMHLYGVFTSVNARGDMFAGWDNGYGIWGRARTAADGWHGMTTAQADVGAVDVLEAIHSSVTPQGDVVLLWEQEARPLRARILNVR
jgi:hypothetical protein